MNERILITGAAGYLGKYLTKPLPQYFKKCKIYCIDKVYSKTKSKKFLKCNVSDKIQLKRILQKVRPHIIFHLVGIGVSINYTWQQFFDVNYKPTETLLEVLKSIPTFKPRIILFGSAAEYGTVPVNEMPIKEETPLNPVSPYGCSKALQSMIAKYYSNIGMDVILIRPFNIIGPEMSEHLSIGNFQNQFKKIVEKKSSSRIYVGNINVRRDYINIEDALRAFCIAAKKGRTGETYNVCGGKAISIKYILQRLCSQYKGKIQFVVDKKLLRNNDVLVSYGSNEKLKKHTGWKPHVSIEKTISSLYPV
ncbi:MAG: GDP-mannose 4,6-dehydratase [Elusimicrobia bacterium]|nr:GDP-mannose 4,6-dehydratase [Elusimicrobiota bacterium]